MIKNCFCIQPPEFNLEDMSAQIRHWFGTVGWFVQVLGGTFRQESDYPTFYHLAVLDYKPCYSQEPWLGINMQAVKNKVHTCCHVANDKKINQK